MICELILSLALLGQEPAAGAADVAAKVQKLVRQLDDDELAVREAAEEELVKLGPDAIAHLPAPTAKVSDEAKERLARVRRQLEIALAESTAKPTRVTLAGEKKLSEVLAEITKQTKNELYDYRGDFNQETTDPKIKIDFKETPFWEAVDRVFDEAGLTLYHYSGRDRALAVVNRAADSELPRVGRAAYAGRFRLEPTMMEARKDLRNPANQTLRMTLELSWEPALRPIVIVQPVDQMVALGEDQKPLVIDGSEQNLEIPVEGNASASEFDINLQLPPRTVTKIASLQGKMTAIVPGRIETFEFADVVAAKNVAIRRAGVAVVLEEFRKNGDVHELRMRIEYDKAANAFESHRAWVFDSPAYLLTPDGEEISNEGYEETRRESNVVGIAYKFVLEEEPKGHKFVFKAPAAIMKLPVEYELKNIELP